MNRHKPLPDPYKHTIFVMKKNKLISAVGLIVIEGLTLALIILAAAKHDYVNAVVFALAMILAHVSSLFPSKEPTEEEIREFEYRNVMRRSQGGDI